MSGKVFDHSSKYTIMTESIRSWVKIYHHWRQVYDHLLKIDDLLFEAIVFKK